MSEVQSDIAHLIRTHAPEVNHREAYCSCGAPVGEWASGWPEHLAALIETAYTSRTQLT